MRTYEGFIMNLDQNEIFVFGSNTQGKHGKGAALTARQRFGAKTGQARGMMGKSYAIATKDLTKSKHPSISTKEIKYEIKLLYVAAKAMPEKLFYVAYSGKGRLLSGFTNYQMAGLWACATPPDNIVFEENFAKLVRSYL